MARILVVEDNVDLAFGLRINLEQEGHEVVVVHDGGNGINAVVAGGIQLVLLDMMLPDIDGLDVVRSVRQQGFDMPVIVLSARADEVDRVGAFRIGVDDYITKPFSLLELIERVKARLRTRYTSEMSPQRILVDLARRTVSHCSVLIPVTRLEFELLITLIRANGAVLSKEQLLHDIWHLPDTVNTRTVDAHIFSLRRKLNMAGVRNALRTVHATGVAWAGNAVLV